MRLGVPLGPPVKSQRPRLPLVLHFRPSAVLIGCILLGTCDFYKTSFSNRWILNLHVFISYILFCVEMGSTASDRAGPDRKGLEREHALLLFGSHGSNLCWNFEIHVA